MLVNEHLLPVTVIMSQITVAIYSNRFLKDLTPKVLVTTIDALGHFLNRIITAQWEGMGDVRSARYEPALLPPFPTIRVLSNSDCPKSIHPISK